MNDSDPSAPLIPASTLTSGKRSISPLLKWWICVFLLVPLFKASCWLKLLLFIARLLIISFHAAIVYQTYDEIAQRNTSQSNQTQTYINITHESYENASSITGIIFLVIRCITIFWIWIKSDDIRMLLSDIVEHSEKENHDGKSKSRKGMILLSVVSLILIGVYTYVLRPFYDDSHVWVPYIIISRIYSSVFIMNVLFIYFIIISEYESMFKSFITEVKTSIPSERNEIPSKLKNIEEFMQRINSIFGPILFLVFTLNFIEVTWAIVFRPRFESSIWCDKNKPWFVAIGRGGLNSLFLITIAIKITKGRQNIAKTIKELQEKIMKFPSSQLALLIISIRDTVNMQFTVWCDCITMSSSIMFNFVYYIIFIGSTIVSYLDMYID